MKIEPSSLQMRAQFAPIDLAFTPPAPVVLPALGNDTSGSDFLQFLEGAVMDVDARNRAASDRMHAVDAGQSDDLAGAMLASQEASLSFSMLMQVRNKVMGAVDEIVKLQV